MWCSATDTFVPDGAYLMARRIGLLGCTFDPVHIGHLRSAVEVAEALQLDQLRLIPSAPPPHRSTPQVSAVDRLAMVRLAVADAGVLQVDDRELQRDKPSYSIDTLESLRSELAARSVSDPSALSGPSGQIAFIWQTPLAVSATQIRSLLASGKSARFLVPDAVLAYIHAHGLYRGAN